MSAENKDPKESKPITANDLAGLLDEFDKRVEKRFVELDTKFDGKLTDLTKKFVPPKEEKKPEEKKAPNDQDPSPSELASQERIKVLEERLRGSSEKAVRAALRSELDKVSTGKLATGVEDLIKDKFLSTATLDVEKETATFLVDGKHYAAVGEAFEKWIALDVHKGYRPAPASQVQTPVQPHVFTGEGNTQTNEIASAIKGAGIQL